MEISKSSHNRGRELLKGSCLDETMWLREGWMIDGRRTGEGEVV